MLWLERLLTRLGLSSPGNIRYIGFIVVLRAPLKGQY